jgi:hypothetical protein
MAVAPQHPLILLIASAVAVAFLVSINWDRLPRESPTSHRRLLLRLGEKGRILDPKTVVLKDVQLQGQVVEEAVYYRQQADAEQPQEIILYPQPPSLPVQQEQQQQPQQEVVGSNLLDPTKVRLSLVISLNAIKPGTPNNDIHPHRKEIRAAILANIMNPYIDQVVVFLDGVQQDNYDEGGNCEKLITGFKMLYNDFMRSDYMDQPTRVEKLHELTVKLTCVNLYSGQPSYYQMFVNTLHKAVLGDVVLLANADQVFDESIILARHLNPDVMVVLGTRGWVEWIPSQVQHIYEKIVGRQYIDAIPGAKKHEDRCLKTLKSYDTWIFHKEQLRGKLEERHFQRLAADDTLKPFYMNENQAENAALWSVLQCHPFTSVLNACNRIRTWSFHLTPKTHKVYESNPWKVYDRDDPRSTPGMAVPKPWDRLSAVKKPLCVREGNCFDFDNDTNGGYTAEELKNAQKVAYPKWYSGGV